MAQRTLTEIQESILLKKSQTPSLSILEVLTTSEQNTLPNLNSSSKVAIWRLWVFIQAFAIWLHEGIFETHKIEIEELIALNKVHTAKWYRSKILAFQYGQALDGESDKYDNTGIDTAVILASQIIKQTSVEEVAGELRIKVATQNALGELEAIDVNQYNALRNYIALVKDAGTKIRLISRPPDEIKFVLDLYFDPTILNGLGQRLDGTNDEPIQKAIKDFLYNLEFNGEFIKTKLTDFVQLIEGVEMPVFKEIYTKYGTYPYSLIDETYIANSGYMVLDLNNTVINFLPRELF
ncbi:hypothetical protein [Flavobacterium phage FPSV-S1]|nr:hypothetical protein [Flavobacterium phage FPSV-S1]QCW20494.1 hypothetical protein [Flavobacterium phage FPSV-S8]QCW20657.1 hypothetical protein [Flavobacterium phage FPSV-S27]